AFDRALELFARLLLTTGLAERYRQPGFGCRVARPARGALERQDRVLASALHQRGGSEQLHRRQIPGIALEHFGSEALGFAREAGLDRRGGILQGKLARALTARGGGQMGG